MKIVVAKVDSRKREAGKDTTVFHNGVQISAEKIENFKKRKTVRESDPASPNARKILLLKPLRPLLMHL
jgi:hypothetical protein